MSILRALFGFGDPTLRGALVRSFVSVNIWTVAVAFFLLSLVPVWQRVASPSAEENLDRIRQDAQPLLRLMSTFRRDQQIELLEQLKDGRLSLRSMTTTGRDGRIVNIYGIAVHVNSNENQLSLVHGRQVVWSQVVTRGVVPNRWAEHLGQVTGDEIFDDDLQGLRARFGTTFSEQPALMRAHLAPTTMMLPIARDQWLVVSNLRPANDILGVVLLVTFLLVLLTWTVIAFLPITVSAVFISSLFARSHARRLAEPLSVISRAARDLATGDLTTRAKVAGPLEVQNLAADMNTIGANLSATMHELQVAREKAEAALLSQRAFFGNISHDLRTPLASILAYSENLEGRMHDTSLNQQVQVIRSEATALSRLVDDLFDLARLNSPAMQLSVAEAKLADVAEEVTSGLAAIAWRSGVLLRLNEDADRNARAYIDVQRLGQVLRNLITNAVRHTQAGGLVELHVRTVGPNVIVTVEDTGVGIPPEELPLVFEQFYTVDKSRSRTGTERHAGLGLAISRALVERMNGDISLESEVGQGTTFTLTFPAAPAGRPQIQQT